MAGSSTDSPRFYYDLASPAAYVAAERVVEALGVVPEFVPVRLAGLAAAGVGTFRCAEEEAIFKAELERRAEAVGVLPLRWPSPFPADTEWAMLVATYAKETGRVVAFSLAAFRQAFAAARDLGERDTVLLAAAAAEMHPAAVVKGAGLRGTQARLAAATANAAEAGVLDVPAVSVGGHVFHGEGGLEAAAAAL
jgi:2-hydroxychromene-2-carboxylate isomerase